MENECIFSFTYGNVCKQQKADQPGQNLQKSHTRSFFLKSVMPVEMVGVKKLESGLKGH